MSFYTSCQTAQNSLQPAFDTGLLRPAPNLFSLQMDFFFARFVFEAATKN